MDGYPNKKSKVYQGQAVSETRYAVIQWLERELPKLTGDVLIVSAGNWDVPKKLLKNAKVKTMDKATYGGSGNNVDFVGDVHTLPADWTNKWDAVISNQAMECYENPFKAMDELYRILKPNGVLLIDCPFNYRWFGGDSWEKPKKDVKDYWRITEDGWRLLIKNFKSTQIEHSGPNKYDPFTYMVKAVK